LGLLFQSQITIHKSQLFHRRLLFLLALVVLTRLLFALLVWHSDGPAGFFRGDTFQYVKPAQSLLHGSFSSSGVFAPESAPELYRTPGYPLLLALGIALHHLVLIAIAENLLLTAISAWLVWLIAEMLFPASNASAWAVLLYCFEPLGLFYANTLMSDTAFTAGLLFFVWLFLRLLRQPGYQRIAHWPDYARIARRPSYARVVLAAVVLGAITYIRPVTLYFGLCLSFLLLLWPREWPKKQRIISAVLFPILFLAMLAPWVIRNIRLADYKGFSTAQEWNLYFTFGVELQATVEHRGVAAAVQQAAVMTPEQYLEMHPEQRTWSEGQKARFWATEAQRMILEHPLVFVRIYGRNCFAVLFNPGVTEVLRELGLFPPDRTTFSTQFDHGYFSAMGWLLRQYPLAAVLLPLMLAQLLLYYALAFAGLRKLPLEIRIFMVGMCVYFVLVSGFLTAGARFRMPIMPLVCVAAGLAIARWKRAATSEANLAADSHV
jgi:4-amino-4-deoxy-L-arabinose transferase-like glycosyltransferase